MKLLAGYLERARQFEFLAGETKDDPRFKRMSRLSNSAVSARKC